MDALGVIVWPMVELEADDALASAAAVAAEDPAVDRVVICTPDKDLAQCVVGERVVQLDRRSGNGERRGRRLGQVRGRARIDPRLAGAGRRLRRRVPRAGRMGQTVGLGRTGPLRELRRRTRSGRRLGSRGPGCGAGCRQAGRPAGRANATRPSCSGSWPPSGWTDPCSTAWRRCSGGDRRRSSKWCAGTSGTPHWPSGRRPSPDRDPASAAGAEDLVEFGGNGGVELRVGARRRGPVRSPTDERGGVTEAVDPGGGRRPPRPPARGAPAPS